MSPFLSLHVYRCLPKTSRVGCREIGRTHQPSLSEDAQREESSDSTPPQRHFYECIRMFLLNACSKIAQSIGMTGREMQDNTWREVECKINCSLQSTEVPRLPCDVKISRSAMCSLHAGLQLLGQPFWESYVSRGNAGYPCCPGSSPHHQCTGMQVQQH